MNNAIVKDREEIERLDSEIANAEKNNKETKKSSNGLVTEVSFYKYLINY